MNRETAVTPSDWATSADPHAMLAYLRDRGVASDRKYRLFAAHCCRRVWHLLSEPSQAAVEVAERAADGRVSDAEWAAARFAAADAVVAATEARNLDPATPEAGILAARAASTAVGLPGRAGPDSAQAAVAACSLAARGPAFGPGREAARATFCDFLREVFGDPFAPVVVDPSWRTEPVMGLATRVNEDGAWVLLPVLADALDDAGADPRLVRHFRESGPHLKGWHVLDAVLGLG